jgi:hypothetical protein
MELNGRQADSRDVVAIMINLRHEYRMRRCRSAAADERSSVHAEYAAVVLKLAIVETVIAHAGNFAKAGAVSIR